MINRTLIRLKVVQLLYSYLIARVDFRLLPEPARRTRDAVWSYAVYTDLLMFIIELSGRSVDGRVALTGVPRQDSNDLYSLRVPKALAEDSAVRELLAREGVRMGRLRGALAPVYRRILNSTVFCDFSRKRKPSLKEETTMWQVLLTTVIARSPELVDVFRNDERHTLAGFEKGLAMVGETLEDFNQVSSMLIDATNQLESALMKSFELYHALLMLPVELTRLREEQLLAAKNKYLPSHDDLNPNTRFIENKFVAALRTTPELEKFCSDNGVGWGGEFYGMKDLLDRVMASPAYIDYMANESESTYEEDCDLWRRLLRDIVLPSDELAEMLEGRSVYWNDDMQVMGTFVLKTVKQAGRDDRTDEKGNRIVTLLPMYKDDEDRRFGPELFAAAVDHRVEYKALIDKYVKADWDPERIAFMDVVVMLTAIAELVRFPQIPLPVTMNEYTEIAADYSMPRSGQFVNGLLYSAAQQLKSEGVINK